MKGERTMSVYHVLYNPLANNRTGEEAFRRAAELLPQGAEAEPHDITKIDDMRGFLEGLAKEDELIVCGGDGTLNRFANAIDGMELEREVYYLAAGTGNDFLRDIGKTAGDGIVPVGRYLKDLPTVRVKDITAKYINGIGYGIDGYCCEEADKIKQKSDKPINYTAIAIGGLMGKFTPVNARVTVDGVTREYKKVWLAPAMKGRFFGGGMMATPGQDRTDPEKKVSVLVYHGVGRLRALIIFPKIFTGDHVKYKKVCDVLTGNSVKVEFDTPTALQIDGETVLNVREYTVETR